MELNLKKIENFEPRKGPVLLIVMDGVGFGKKDESDCVHLANTPTLDKLLQSKNQAVHGSQSQTHPVCFHVPNAVLI